MDLFVSALSRPPMSGSEPPSSEAISDPGECSNEIAALQILLDDHSKSIATAAQSDAVDAEENPLRDAEMRFQAALSALMSDQDARDLARENGVRFQKRYRLTNKQMISLALVAIHTGEATLHREMRDLKRLSDPSAVVGSCCCSCP
jgi:hypothetical protein